MTADVYAIPGRDGYFISLDGAVTDRFGNALKTERHARTGALSVRPRIEGRTRRLYVHRLWLETFITPCPREKWVAAARDGDLTNLSATNLFWCSLDEANRLKRSLNRQAVVA